MRDAIGILLVIIRMYAVGRDRMTFLPLSFPKIQRGWILSIRAFEAVWFMPEMIALPVV